MVSFVSNIECSFSLHITQISCIYILFHKTIRTMYLGDDITNSSFNMLISIIFVTSNDYIFQILFYVMIKDNRNHVQQQSFFRVISFNTLHLNQIKISFQQKIYKYVTVIKNIMNEQDTKASSELKYEKLVMIGTFVNFFFYILPLIYAATNS